MGKPAIASRRFQFVAGPEKHVFYACEDHVKHLSDAQLTPLCFMVLSAEPIVNHAPEDEEECDFCREGG